MIASGSAFGGIFGGFVSNANPDWRWVFWMNSILTGVCLLTTFLFQAETNFDRPAEFETGEGLESSQLPAVRSRIKPSWTQSLGVVSWYDRYALLLSWRYIACLLC